MIKTIIIDDEEASISYLEILIKDYCPNLQVVATCRSAKDGIDAILIHSPELLFLDIEMPIENGFYVLEHVRHLPLRVIFTTAYQQHAIRAIRYSALDYLLKPIDPKEMVIAVNRFFEYKSVPDIRQLQFFIDKLAQKEHTNRKIAIPNVEGFSLISVDDIIFCSADDNYTDIVLKNKIKLTASRTLKDIQILLEDYDHFFRIHHSYLINLNEVKKYLKGEGGFVILSDGSNLSVSRNRKAALLSHLAK